MVGKIYHRVSNKITGSMSSLVILFGLLSLGLFSLTLTSCHKGEFSVSQVIAQPYVVRANVQEAQEMQQNENSWTMGLSLYVHAVVSSPSDMQMVVTDPTSSLSWTFVPTSSTFDGVTYYGSSNIMLPQGIMLAQGTWNLEILYKDGRTFSFPFQVAYSNLENALDLETLTPFYDATSNLTVL